MKVDWKITVNEFGEYWDYKIGDYRFRIAIPNVKEFWKRSMCSLYINRSREDLKRVYWLENRNFNSILAANEIAEKVLELICDSKAYMAGVDEIVQKIKNKSNEVENGKEEAQRYDYR